MGDRLEKARSFFDACDSGKGWEVCMQYCHADATFSVQAGALADVHTLEGYVEWAKGLLGPLPDAHCEMRFIAEDKAKDSVAAYSVFSGTHTGSGGPIPPTGKSTASDYVYVVKFEGERIRHMTKIWNDAMCLHELGWG